MRIRTTLLSLVLPCFLSCTTDAATTEFAINTEIIVSPPTPNITTNVTTVNNIRRIVATHGSTILKVSAKLDNPNAASEVCTNNQWWGLFRNRVSLFLKVTALDGDSFINDPSTNKTVCYTPSTFNSVSNWTVSSPYDNPMLVAGVYSLRYRFIVFMK